MNASKVNPENLVVIRYDKFASINTALRTLDCDWSLHKFIEENFSKLTDNNQIFRIDFACNHFHF